MAEILFEAIGSKNQHDELLDFHSRFDRELGQSAANPKVIDIHSITKESKNNYPELIKDLLDHIPFYEPFDGDGAKERSRGRVEEDINPHLCFQFYDLLQRGHHIRCVQFRFIVISLCKFRSHRVGQCSRFRCGTGRIETGSE